MAEDSGFWGGTTVGDASSADVWKAPYTSEEWSDMWSKMFTSDSSSGFVIPLHEDELAVEAENPASMDVSVLSGVAKIRGRLYENTATSTLTIADNASGNPRIDRVILRTSFAAQTIRLVVLQGTPGATPALPTLTQDANTWEVSLAYIWVANGAASIADEEIHDERIFLKTSLSHKYEAGSQNLIKNSEFMGFSELSGGATTNPPDNWSLVNTPSDIASATKYSGMPRGRAVQITTDAASEGISTSVTLKESSPHTLKMPIKVTAGDVGGIKIYSDSSLTSYSDANKNIGVPLRGPTGAGATTTVDTTGATATSIGDAGGLEYWRAQTFQVTAGIISQVAFRLGANTGAPSGNCTWEICVDGVTAPSTILATGSIALTPSAENTITIVDGPFLDAGTTYWLVLRVPAQATNVFYTILRNTTNPYASGSHFYTNDAGATWNNVAGSDLRCSVTTSAVSIRDKLAQGFQVSEGHLVNYIQLYLKKIGSPAGTLTLRVETDNAGSPSGNLIHAAATTTVTEASLTTAYSDIVFTYATDFVVDSSTQYHIVLSTDRAASNTDYISWGSDDSAPSYANGELKSEATGSWSAESKDGCFDIRFSFSKEKYIRRTGSFIEEVIYFNEFLANLEISIQLLGLNNGDVVQFGQCLLLEGRHPGPFREIHETVLFRDGITDTNWTADAKSDSTTTIDLDADFQGLVLPGTRQVLVGLTALDTTDDGIMTSYAKTNQDTGVVLQGAAGIDKIAQSIQVGAGTATEIKLYLKKTGSPVGDLLVTIETDNAGSPSGTWVTPNAYTNYRNESLLSTSYSWVSYYLTTPLDLLGATTYWIVLWVNRVSSATDFTTWGADGSAPSYASGQLKSLNGVTWSVESKDGCFELRSAGTAIISLLSARKKGGTKDYARVSLVSRVPNLDTYAQGWVTINNDNQFDLYVVDTTVGSILCTAKIIGIEI